MVGSNPARNSKERALSQFKRGYLRDQIALLRNFGAEVAQPSVIDNARALIPDVIERAEWLGFSRAIIADECETTQATLSRWASRQVIPHQLVARTVVRLIGEMALRHAEKLAKNSKKLERARSPN
jgi:hypothetical protein